MLLLVAALWALVGCANPNMYGVARTLPPNSLHYGIAAEAVAHTDSLGTVASPALPTVFLRAGVTDRVDVGARLSHLSSLGFDVKYNFLSTDLLALAVAPGVEGLWLPLGSNGVGVARGHVPLVAAIDVATHVTLVGTAGVSAFRTIPNPSLYVREKSGFASRIGAAARLRITDTFAIAPEITVLRDLSTSSKEISAGVAFVVGTLP